MNNFFKPKIDDFRWGGLNDFFNDIYITMCFGCCINTSTLLQFSNVGTAINNLFAAIMLTAIVLVPLYISVKLSKLWKLDPKTQEKYQQYEGGQHES